MRIFFLWNFYMKRENMRKKLKILKTFGRGFLFLIKWTRNYVSLNDFCFLQEWEGYCTIRSLGGAYMVSQEVGVDVAVFNAISRKKSITDGRQFTCTRIQLARNLRSPRERAIGTERESARTVFFHHEEDNRGSLAFRSTPVQGEEESRAPKRYIHAPRRRNGARELLRNARRSCVVVACV